MAMLALNYGMCQWRHDRNDAVLETIPYLKHVCCFTCSCGKTQDETTKAIVNEVKASKTKEVVLVFRMSLHAKNDVKRMASDIQTWVNALEPLTRSGGKTISLLHVTQHGAGWRKPSKYLPDQGSVSLQAYDSKVITKLIIPPSMELYHFDAAPLFQGAECEGDGYECAEACNGAYESPDRTHMSLTSQIAVARLVFEGFGM
jgi:hypothetical protein